MALVREEECPICFVLGPKVEVTLPCRHTICLHCFCRLAKAVCPMCRHDFSQLVTAPPIRVQPDYAQTDHVMRVICSSHGTGDILEHAVLYRSVCRSILVRPISTSAV